MLYRNYGKRTIDLLILLATLPFWLMAMILVAISVRILLGRPILFSQKRPGKQGNLFTLYKFRSMTNACDKQGNLLSDRQRITRFGKFLRSTSLDEIPEFWNVLIGDMSLVGPRPLLTKYLTLYTAEQIKRHDVRPGITGWAQTNGRNALDWDSRLALDAWYVKHCTFWLDCKILIRTIFTVLRRENIHAHNHVTSPEFLGQTSNHRVHAKEGVVVIGAGGHAKVVIATLQATGQPVATVYDDDKRLWGQAILGIPIRGPVSDLQQQTGRKAVIAIGDNQVRKTISAQLEMDWICAVHPSAQVHSTSQLGKGTVVFAGAVIQPEVKVGAHSIINTSSSVDHDCSLGPFVHVGPGVHLAGNVRLGASVSLGIGSNVIPDISIEKNTVVGAGAVVLMDLPPNVLSVGTPARIVKQRAPRKAA